MIYEGYKSKAKDWGNYTAKKVVKLNKPVECFSKNKGKALFNPTIVKLEWEYPPSEDKNEIWFPYWITWTEVNNKERYGQHSPMIGEKALLELLTGAIDNDFFTDGFLQEIRQAISEKLGSN